MTDGFERPGLDERLDRSFVEDVDVHPIDEVGERRERTFSSSFVDLLDDGFSDVSYRRQSEEDEAVANHKVRFRPII